ncbi:hypothetical protein ACVWWR_002361 [Bradyrhizobium sp. LM3.2]
MSWTADCATSPVDHPSSRPGDKMMPRVPARGAVRHRTPEISPSRPTSGISPHAPGCDDAVAGIADVLHPRAEWALYHKQNAGAVREHDDFLGRIALDGHRKRNVG